MNDKLLRQFINETLRDRGFIRHLQNGLRYGNGQLELEACQIASDWLEEVELRMGNLLAPGHVTQVERFVVQNWPSVTEQFHGNQTLALITMSNMLDAKFNELTGG